MSENNCAVLLAAGEGKRMKWDRPKVLSPVLFKPMLQWVLDSVHSAGINQICAVTGYLHEEVEQYLSEHEPEAAHVLQQPQLGTGHAVMAAADFLRSSGADGNTLILNGDAPFIDAQMIRGALDAHRKTGNSVTVVSAVLNDPTGYGRIVRDENTNLISAIVEQKDAGADVLNIKEVNSGAYWFKTGDLLNVLTQIKNDNAQGEYYLTDAVQLLIAQGKEAGACTTGSANAVLGANDCLQLNQLNNIARKKILLGLLKNGTEIPCTDGVVIGPDVTIAGNVCILPGTVLQGKTAVGPGCVLGPNTVLTDCTVGGHVTLNSVQCGGCTITADTPVKPFTVYDPLK